MGKYQGYEKYKASGVEWLGTIPEHWKRLSLRWLIQTSSGDFISNLDTEPEITNEVFIPVVGGNGIMSYTNKKNTKANSLVVGRVGAHCGNVHLFKENTWVTDNALLITIKPQSAHSDFLFWLLKSLNLNDTANKNAQPLITGEMIKGRSIAIPPVDEQESIARFLDRKTSQIDALIAKKTALLEKLDEKRTALISHAVTKGLDRSVPMKDSGVEWLGDIPEHWEIKRLRFLVVMHGGSTPNKANPEFWDGEIPWISAKDLKTERLKSSVDTITDKALQETSIHIHPKNGVVIVVRGMILAHSFPVAINDIDITINQDLKVLRTSQSNEFLAILLRGVKNIVLSIMEESGHGTKVLRTDLFKNVELPHPPQVEQGEIVNYVHQKTAEIDRQKGKVKEAIELLKEYRTALITNAVTGKIDVRQVGRV